MRGRIRDALTTTRRLVWPLRCRGVATEANMMPSPQRVAGGRGQRPKPLARPCVPVEAYSQAAEQVGELSAGDAVLLSGKWPWTCYAAKDGTKKTSLAVLALRTRHGFR